MKNSATASDIAQTALLHQIALRDPAALGELYDAHSVYLYSVAFEIVDNEAEAEEVLLNAFGDVWDNIAAYATDPEPVFVRLTSISREFAVGRLRSMNGPIRKTMKSAEVRGESASEWATRLGVLAFQSGEYLGFVEVLGQLTPEQRSLIEHAYFRGLTQSELAELFDLHLESVKNLIRSGMLALQIGLEPSIEDSRMSSLYLEELASLDALGALDGEDVVEFGRIAPNVTPSVPKEITSFERVAALFAIATAKERTPSPTVRQKLLSRIR